MNEQSQVAAFLELLMLNTQQRNNNPLNPFAFSTYQDMAQNLPEGYVLTVGGAGEAGLGVGTSVGAELNGGIVISKSGETYSYFGGALTADVLDLPISAGFELGIVKGAANDFHGGSLEAEAAAVVGGGVTVPIGQSLDSAYAAMSSAVSGDFVSAAEYLSTAPVGTRLYYKIGVEQGIGVEIGFTAVQRQGGSVTLNDFDWEASSLEDLHKTINEQTNPYCFAAGTPIEMADGTTKPIEDICLGDKVLAFDPGAEGGRGVKVAKRVTQLHRTENQPLINFHGTKVTPGHAYLTGEGAFLPIIEILQNDGTVVMSDGRVIRARTGWPVDSREDKVIPIGYPEGGAIKLTTMRAGTLYGGKDGKAYTIEQMMNSRGYHMMSDGRFIGIEGDIKTAYWEWGVPDDKMIAGRYAAYADLVEGSAIGIGMPLVPSRPN